ncbi:MAG TPA: tRNA (guanosine(37)-N1)-methyltransferase TrmD [Candidatus Paceibacterota bacterium]
MIRFHIISLFPEALRTYLGASMLWKAQRDKKIKIKVINPRDYTHDKHRRADDRPYGGGPGMVLKAEPLLKATAKVLSEAKNKSRIKIVVTSPRGKQFDNKMAIKWSKQYNNIVIIAGHYEGIDARVKKVLRAEEISVGPYTLTGGELPSMIMVDALTRQIPGVLGDPESLEEKRDAPREIYTRPEVFKFKGKNYRVPKVLLSGNPAKIKEWRTNSPELRSSSLIYKRG